MLREHHEELNSPWEDTRGRKGLGNAIPVTPGESGEARLGDKARKVNQRRYKPEQGWKVEVPHWKWTPRSEKMELAGGVR
jgi:hypothetical protein